MSLRSAFDPEHGQKGGVKTLEEEIERYRRWETKSFFIFFLKRKRLRYAEILRTQIVDSVTLLHQDVSLGSKAREQWMCFSVRCWLRGPMQPSLTSTLASWSFFRAAFSLEMM